MKESREVGYAAEFYWQMGYGTRLYPIMTRGGESKHLLPIYNKPMIYYFLTTLMRVGIQKILVITHPREMGCYQKILEDGSQWGLRILYKTQPKPLNIVENFF